MNRVLFLIYIILILISTGCAKPVVPAGGCVEVVEVIVLSMW